MNHKKLIPETTKMERVKVHLRIKPFTDPELHDTFVTTYNKTCIEQVSQVEAQYMAEKQYTYDSVLAMDCSQAQVYQKVGFPIVQDVMEGYNGTIMAYGQTSSGKTHTMVGVEGGDRGVIPRCLEDIFDRTSTLNSEKDCKVVLRVSYLQVYCERILDLLNPQMESSELSVREDATTGVTVAGATLTVVNSVQECMKCLEMGNANRATASTNMNAHSSRSHAIFMLQVERHEMKEDIQQVKISQLYLVDLAGSERVAKSLVKGSRFNELKSINLSLSALGNCVFALAKQQSHVPYRDSKLTRILQGSLGGNAKTSLIITASPALTEASETGSTLQFGQRCMKVAVRAHLNIIPDYKVLYESVQSKIDRRDDHIHELEIKLQESTDKHQALQDKFSALQLENDQRVAECEALKAQNLVNIKGLPEDMETLIKEHNIELSTLRTQHMNTIDSMKVHFNTQIESYKANFNASTQEWHCSEQNLSAERTAHLETLQKYRDCREKLTNLEKESMDRVSELHQELENLQLTQHQLTAELDTGKNISANQGNKIESSMAELEETQKALSALQAKISSDYVPRDQIDQVEKLYSEAITKLQTRVNSLEVSKPTSATSKSSSWPAKKAQARVGRVLPGNQSTRFR